MGGSRRRLKRGKSKVRVGVVKRKRTTKAQLPQELADARPDLCKRLPEHSITWEETATLTRNYAANAFVQDPNEGFGRNRRAGLKTPEQREQEDGATFDDDDELRAALGKERKSGKAPPKRLTSHQRAIVERLIAAHGADNVGAMFRDRKLNPMQHSEGKLRELLEAYGYWSAPERAKHGFRAPNKPPVRNLCR